MRSPRTSRSRADGDVDPDGPRVPTSPSFRQVYREHFDFVWRFAQNLGVGRAHLDDAVQDVFIVVSRRLNTFEGRSSLKTWIGGVARNVILDRLRREASLPKVQGMDEHAEHVPDPRDPVRRAELLAAAEMMRRILATMTPLQREAFILCEIEEFSAVEVSLLLDTNENTLRARLKSARTAFQVALSAEREKASGDA